MSASTRAASARHPRGTRAAPARHPRGSSHPRAEALKSNSRLLGIRLYAATATATATAAAAAAAAATMMTMRSMTTTDNGTLANTNTVAAGPKASNWHWQQRQPFAISPLPQ
jgi:hypothetical protein